MREPKSTLKKLSPDTNAVHTDDGLEALASKLIPRAIEPAVIGLRGRGRTSGTFEFDGPGRSLRERFVRRFRADLPLYLMALLPMAVVILFKYFPMYGVQIAFRNYTVAEGMWGSQWVGLKHFIDFFRSPYFFRVTRNTLVLGFWSLIICFPAPILLALLMNELRSSGYKRVVQTISYLPHFLSTVVIIGIYIDLTRVVDGRINEIIEFLGGKRINFWVEPGWFRFLYITSDLWQGIGWGTILYLAAISGVDLELYEAAVVDGAGRLRQMWHVTLACIAPTIIITFILRVGGIVSNDWTKIMLMYNQSTYETADVIGTYIYRIGIVGGNAGFGTAVGLLLNVISLFLVLGTNSIARRLGEYTLW
jgi:putative aldouronate transport system permease protein